MSTLSFLPQLEPGIFYPQQARRYEKNSATGEGGLRIIKYCRPPWLADEENFSFLIV